MTATVTDDDEVAAAEVAVRWPLAGAQLSRLSGGLINQTFAAVRDGEPLAVLQALHPAFGAEVNLDIEALTLHLADRGMHTPRLLRTVDGAAWVSHQDRIWRALSWVEGRSVGRVPDPSWAEAGGALVGQFHRAVADFSHEYRFTRGNVHDTPRYLARLRDLLAEPVPAGADRLAAGSEPGSEAGSEDAGPSDWRAQALELAHQLLSVPLPALPETARRHCHGDLKISNLMFSAGPPVVGRALVDLDTISLGTMAFELGDAMRSWCNPCGEDQVTASFELPVFAAAMRGFRGQADALLGDAERLSIACGLQTVCVELAARFCIDVFEDRYFGWNPARYSSRRAHNLVRAQGQLSLARSVATRFDDVVALACGALP